MRLQRVLEVLRRDVLPTGRHEDVLLPVGDREKAVLVEVAEIARAQPAVAREDFPRGPLVLEVAGEVGVSLDQHLAVVGDAQLDTRKGRPGGARSRAVLRATPTRSARP